MMEPTMTNVSAESARQWRDKQRGGPPRELKPHGTTAAMRRHERDGEPLCDECDKVRKDRNAAYYRKRKAQQ